tara:strand:+ start:135 stop:722 length:588 start_codon:yes stop_codon:yes gene_type:complete
MTAISALQSIHKKGTFGDHHKKNEEELLKISELKNLNIVQVVQFKKSEVKLSNIKLDGLNFSEIASKVASNENTRILWNAPRTWIVVSVKGDILENINKIFDSKNFAVTDISHSRAIIQIKGQNAREVLKKGCPLNLNEFKKNNCAGSVFNGINILVDFVDDNSDIINILTLRSFGETFYHHITDSALEFGYVGI